MNIIAELETTPRKIYTGSIGYISPNRKAQFNVAIRTALIDRENKTAEYGVGGGIVWDSTSADEYSEALLKARVLTERPRDVRFDRDPAVDSRRRLFSARETPERECRILLNISAFHFQVEEFERSA